MIIRTGITTFLAASVIAGASLTPAFGQEETRQFSTQSGEHVNQALELANANKFDDALAILRRALSDTDLTAYERSTLYQMMGQYSYELNRPVQAQHAFENAVSAGGLLPGEADNIKTVIAQLMIGNGQFRDGAEALEAYLSAGGEQKSQYVDLLVNAWVQAEDYERALPWAEIWFETADPKMRRHYDLMNFLYVQLEMRDAQIEIIKKMINRWPDDTTLWDSLASALAQSGREKEAFEVTKLMYQSGLLKTEDEILTLVKYHNYYEMPFQAAEILEAEIRDGRVSKTTDNLKFLASLFRQARIQDRALPIMEEVAKLSNNLETHAELAETLSQMGECNKAKTVFRTAIQQGYAEDKALLLIGSCYADNVTNVEKLTCNMSESEVTNAPITLARKTAIESFEAVPKTSEYYADARKWVTFITADLQAYERRCGHDWPGVERELCYQKISKLYDSDLFVPGVKLEDKDCEKYFADYKAKFRVKIVQE